MFHGKWRFPEKDEFRRQFREYQECMGTLYYNENKPIKLEVYHEPTQGVIARMDGYYDTIWGKDANGYEFTLFNVTMDDPIKDDTVVDISKFVFTIILSIVSYWVAMFNQWMNRYSIFAR